MIALSTLMTDTMEQMALVVRLLEAESIRHGFKVIVGGSWPGTGGRAS